MMLNTFAVAVTLTAAAVIAAPEQSSPTRAEPAPMREVRPAPASDTPPVEGRTTPADGRAQSPSASTEPSARPRISANQPAMPEARSASQDSATPRASDGLLEAPEPRRRTSAADVLRELRQEVSKTPIIPPTTVGVQRSAPRTTVSESAIPTNALRPVDRKLMPDGARIIDRAGRLTRDGDYLTFTFESRGEGPVEVPLRLLPNRLLEDMEVVAEGGRRSIVFVVSGEVTEYRGVNYLMLQKLLMRPDLGNFE